MIEQDYIMGLTKEEFEIHITELIRRLKIIFISLSATTLIVILIPEKILQGDLSLADYSPAISLVLKQVLVWATMLAETQSGGNINFQFTLGAPYSLIIVMIELGVIIAIILNIPLISYQIYDYIRPALYEEEADFAIKLSLSFGTLFATGVFVGILLVPLMVQTLFSLTTVVDYGRIINFVPVESFVHFIFFSLIGTGILFTFPIWIIFLALMRVITSEDLIRRRRPILVGLFGITAIITPDPTPISMILLSFPMMVLYEIAIVIIMRYEERHSSQDGIGVMKRIKEVWEDTSFN